MELGFSVLRHPNAIHYDYSYIHSAQETQLAPEDDQRSPADVPNDDLF
jgi:hypothetical protein